MINVSSFQTEGLVLDFPFDENTGDVVIDQTDNKNDGDIQEAIWTEGYIGSALQFNGSEKVVVDNDDILDSINEMSFTAWIKIDPIDSDLHFFALAGGFALFQQSYELGLAISVPSTDNAQGVMKISDINEWTFIAGSYDGVDINFYINGNLTGTKNHPGTMSKGYDTLTIGFFNNDYWNGTIDELKIWNRVLTVDEIQEVFKITTRDDIITSRAGTVRFQPMIMLIVITLVIKNKYNTH